MASHDEILVRLQSETRTAKERFEMARAEVRRVLDPGASSSMPLQDGSFAGRRALKQESEAWRMYYNSLLQLHQFLMSGTLPGDESRQ